jgi:hypothetical protein
LPALLPNYLHIAQSQSAASSIANVLRFDAQVFSESLIFGLGSGLGFYYFNRPSENPSVHISGRANEFEDNFYKLLGAQLEWAGAWDPFWIREELTLGRPILAQCDGSRLNSHPAAAKVLTPQQPYLPLYSVVIIGCDIDAHTLTYADRAYAVPQTIDFDTFYQASIGEGCPLMRPHSMAVAPYLELSVTDVLLAESIRITIEAMLNPARREIGLPALRTLARELPQMVERPDLIPTMQFAALCLDSRDCPADAGRQLYADFLREAGRWIPELKSIEADARCRDNGLLWREFSIACKVVAGSKTASALALAGAAASRVARAEENLLRDLSDVIRPIL